MNVIVFASRKGGSGKSTLAAHLAAQAHKPPSRVLMLDADPQGSLTLWHKLRSNAEPPLADGSSNLPAAVLQAERAGYEWVFIDTPPNVSAIVADAIQALCDDPTTHPDVKSKALEMRNLLQERK